MLFRRYGGNISDENFPDVTQPDGFDAMVNIPLTMLDDPRAFPPLNRNLHRREAAVGMNACSSQFQKVSGI